MSQAITASREHREFLTGLARAFGGAIVFALPMFMTMEMWQLGFSIPPLRFALLLLLVVPLLVGLSHYIGFEDTFDWKDDVADAFVAYGVGFLAAAPLLFIMGIVNAAMSADEIVGKIAVQAVPGAIGALLAQSQFGAGVGRRAREEEREDTYGGEMFFMAAGAVFLSLNVAPTEEIIVISYEMAFWQTVSLCVTSILLMHAFVYSVEFKGHASVAQETPWWSVFARYTIAGYAACLLISVFMLWTFGRIEGQSVEEILTTTIVLAFPGAIGAASARLVL